MSRHLTDAIIYKLHRYSDSSAVARAFTADFGKIKLFVPKAFSKKGGLLTCFPGVLDFQMKESSDLFRFYAFTQKPEFHRFINSHEIMIRLHFIFEVMDALYEEREKDGYLMRLIMKIDDANFRKATAFTVRHMFEKNGVLPDFSVCTNCGAEECTDGFVPGGEFFCSNCRGAGVRAGGTVMLFMKSALSSEMMKNLIVNRENETEIISFFADFYKSLYGKELKSIATLKMLI
jgi:DNA repair protein RecO (recombination protein O)